MTLKRYSIATISVCLAIGGVLWIAHIREVPAHAPTAVSVPVADTPSPATAQQTAQPTSPLPAATSMQATSGAGVAPQQPSAPTSVFIPVATRESVLQAMRSYASSSAAFSFTEIEYPSLGSMIDSIDARGNGNGFYWILYVNGVSSSLGASSAVVSPGDSVEWRYEKSY